MIEMESPDGPQDRSKAADFDNGCDGDADEDYRAISEFLRSLGGNDKLENATIDAPKQDPASSEYAGGIATSRRRNVRRRAMARATQTV